LTATWLTVLPEDSGNLSYATLVIRIDSSTKITSLVPSVSSVQTMPNQKMF